MMLPLSRRNQDDPTQDLFFDIFNKEIDQALRPGAALLILKEAINGANNENAAPKERATYHMIAENLIKILPKKEMYRPIFEEAKNNKIEIGEEARTERMHRLGLKTQSVSTLAEAALENLKPDEFGKVISSSGHSDLEDAFQ
jgi:hypothetical protein